MRVGRSFTACAAVIRPARLIKYVGLRVTTRPLSFNVFYSIEMSAEPLAIQQVFGINFNDVE